MKINILIVLLLFSCTFNLFAQPTKQMVDGIIAIIGDKVVLKSEVEQQFVEILNEKKDADPIMKCQILEQIMISKLMLRQAEIDSITVSDDEIDGTLNRKLRYYTQMLGGIEKLEEFYGKSILEMKEEFRAATKEQALVQRMQDKITSGIQVSPEEVKAYFKRIPTDSLPFFPSEVEYGQIVLFPKVSDEARDYTVKRLEEIRQRVLKGESFTNLAILYSQDPGSAVNGGELGFFGRGDMVTEFEGQAFKLKPAEVSQVFRSKFGYHIMQVIERRGERVNARHILLKPPVGNRELEASRQKLDSIRTLILDGKLTFQEGVRRFSDDDETKASAGMVQNPQTGQNTMTVDLLTPDVYFYIEKMQAGEISLPIAYQAPDGTKGYRIIYLKARSKPHQASLKEDYGKIQQAALSAKRAEHLRNWVVKAKDRTYIKVDHMYKYCDRLAPWF